VNPYLASTTNKDRKNRNKNERSRKKKQKKNTMNSLQHQRILCVKYKENRRIENPPLTICKERNETCDKLFKTPAS
jgi:hypothetical protein